MRKKREVGKLDELALGEEGMGKSGIMNWRLKRENLGVGKGKKSSV